tara:strand:- start:1963 stop:2658 length:696 start_codon:yes stop_codon:yes gene_type:complete
MKTLFSDVLKRPSANLHWDDRLDLESRVRQYRYLARDLGDRYADCTFEDFELYAKTSSKTGGKVNQQEVLDGVKAYCEDIESLLKEHASGLVLFGPPGTGKDHLMTAALYWATLKHGYRCVWRDGSVLAQQIRAMIGGNESESQFIDRLVDPQILALSDPVPPKGEAREFYVDVLQRVVDRRYRRHRSTWATINAAGKEAEQRLSPALVDRLRHNATTFNCNWPTYRKVRS